MKTGWAHGVLTDGPVTVQSYANWTDLVLHYSKGGDNRFHVSHSTLVDIQNAWG